MEFNLHPKIFEEFLKHYEDITNPLSMMTQFKFYVKKELEQRLSDFPAFGSTDSEFKNIKIAEINFAF